MTLTVSDAVLQARFQAVADHLDAASDPAEIWFYPAPRAASLSDWPADPPLVRVVLSKPCGTATPTALTLALPPDPSQVDIDGTAAWGRVVDGSGTPCMDGDAALADGSGTQPEEFLLSRVDMYAGAFVVLVSGVFTEG
ncbi:hypothetical protein [Niveibacterium sp. SC-1]|uniref:hypothetical protein n=1 Tax=Niveibacterium sp. SC-1 TaxID=3135646 RepID=UPI00311D2F0F